MNQPEVGVRHQHTWRHDLHLAAGLSQVYSLRNTESQSISKYPSPILQVDLGSLLQLTRTTIVRSTVSAESAAFVDPVLGVAVSRGTATAGIDIQRGPWSGGARLAFTTDLTSLPSQNTPSTTSSGQTFVSVEIPFRYRSSRQLTVEFGGRYSERAPYLGTKNFAWHNREMWLFLNITTTATPSSTRS